MVTELAEQLGVTPSTMSINTTSQSSFSANRWAVVAPTLPAPTTVTFFSMIPPYGRFIVFL